MKQLWKKIDAALTPTWRDWLIAGLFVVCGTASVIAAIVHNLNH